MYIPQCVGMWNAIDRLADIVQMHVEAARVNAARDCLGEDDTAKSRRHEHNVKPQSDSDKEKSDSESDDSSSETSGSSSSDGESSDGD